MENEEVKQSETVVKNEIIVRPKRDIKKLIKDILYYTCIVALICIIIYMYVASRPFETDEISCKYKEKQDKIVCTQTGDVVPEWLDININGGLFGSDNYSMRLIFSKDNKDYVSMKMKDAVFVAGMHRKFIYEAEDQSLRDYINFKKFAKTGKMNNWGSSILYCSDLNISSHDVCREAKRRYRK